MAVKKLADIGNLSAIKRTANTNLKDLLTLANQGLISSIWFLASIQKMKR